MSKKSNGFKLSLTIISVLLLAAVLVACGDATNTAGPAATTAAATTVAPAATTAMAMTTAAPAATTAMAMTSASATTAMAMTTAAPAATTPVAAMTTAAGTTGGSADTLPAGLSASSLNANLNGSGSTLVNPALKIWQTQFGTLAPNVKVNYPAGGSGQGRTDFLTGKTDFGVSDVQVSNDEATKNNKQLADIIQIPATLAAVVVTYNLSGVADLKLSPDTLSGIYNGKITSWDDAKIKAENPDASLPSLPIKFAVRAESSGTSQVFTSYLSAISPEFKTAVGAASQPKWEGAGINVTTASGNDGVAGLVKQTPGTIGYVELAFALQQNLPYASLKNAGGKYVKPSIETTAAAGASAKADDNLKVDLINQPGDQAYPIATTTYILLNKTYSDAAKGQAVIGFVWYALHKGQTDAKAANYAPLPASIVSAAEAKLKVITAGGSPVVK